MQAFAVAQQPAARNFNLQTGLPSNTVYSLVQDSKGFLWLGTEKGLIRFDGKHYKVFSNAVANGKAMSDVRIDDDILRCQNFSGQHFYVSHDTLQIDSTFEVTGNYAPVLQAVNGVAFYYGFSEVYKHNGRTSIMSFKSHILDVFEYNNRVYAFDSAYLYDVDGKPDSTLIPFSLRGETVFFSVQVADKTFVFPRNMQQQSVYQFMPHFKRLSVNLPAVLIQSVDVIADSLIFVSTNNGLYVLDKALKMLNWPQPLLLNRSVSGAFRDADGSIWVSTLDNGLYQYNCFECTFYPSADPLKSVFYSKEQRATLLGSGSGNVMEWRQNQPLRTVFSCNGRQQINALHSDANQTLFVGGDMFWVQRNNGPVTTISLAVKHIVPLPDGNLLLARTGGISFFTYSRLPDSANIKIAFKNNYCTIFDWYDINKGNLRVRKVAYDSLNKKIYAVTSLGLLLLQKQQWKQVLRNQLPLLVNDIALRNDTLFALLHDTLVLVKNDRLIAEIVLPLAVTSVKADVSGFWLTHGSKLSRLSNKLRDFFTYDFTNGYEVNDFYDTGEELLIATDAGLAHVPKQVLTPTHQSLQFLIEELSVNGKIFKQHSELKLDHKHNNLKLVFSIPFYGNKEDLNVQYKMNGEPWQKLENGLRELNLISLEPGNYKIQFKAITQEGKTSNVQMIAFNIQPPFWKTWWFYILSLVVVASIVYAFYSYRLKLIKEKSWLQQQKLMLENKLRESILASVKAQMNPHFIFNALNTIQSYIYLNDKQHATAYLGKFSQLTRTILDMSNKNSVSLEEEIEAILLYLDLEKMRFDDDMNFVIEVAPDVNKNDVRIPSMIIQPYIENAVKHGLLHKKGERWLKCSFEVHNNMLKVTIDDNGIGRARSMDLNKIKNRKHQSFATQANEKRLDALNRGHSGSVSVRYIDKSSSQGEPLGTTVELMIALLEE